MEEKKKKTKKITINKIRSRCANILKDKYRLKCQFYLIKEIDKITEGDICKEEIRYKDNLIYQNQNESLNRYYKIGESIIRLKNYIDFYIKLKDYLQINYEILDQRKLMFKNHKRKYKLDKRLLKDKKHIKKKKRLDIQHRLLKESTIYLERVNSNNSIRYKNSICEEGEGEDNKFECFFRKHELDESIHDIYNPHFSSDESFFCGVDFCNKDNFIFDFKAIDVLVDEEFSIDSIITDSSLEKIDESYIEKKVVDISALNINDLPEIIDLKIKKPKEIFLPNNFCMKKKKNNPLYIELNSDDIKRKNTYNKNDKIQKIPKLNQSYKKKRVNKISVKKGAVKGEIKEFFERLEKLKNMSDNEKATDIKKLKIKKNKKKKGKNRKKDKQSKKFKKSEKKP